MAEADDDGAPPPVLEPEARPAHGPRAVPMLAAAVLALVGWLLAPADWSAGDGRLEVAVRGEVVLRAPVRIGATDAVTLAADDVVATLPAGVPTDAPVEVEVRVPGAVLGDVSVVLERPGGEREPVPLLRRTDDGLEGARRPPSGVPLALALLGAVVVLWVTEAVPLHVTSMLVPVVLATGGDVVATDALEPFADPIIVLFFAGFLLAEAMRRVGLDRLVATAIVARFGTGPVQLYVAMLGLAAFLSMWMSNTAAVAVLLPIALTVCAPLRHAGYTRAIVLGLAWAATLGGVGSAIGTPANQLAIRFIDELVGREITFAEWFAVGLPLVLLLLPLLGAYLWRVAGARPPEERFAEARAAALAERAEAGPSTGAQRAVLAVMVLVAIGWLTQSQHGTSPGIVALAGVLVLAVVDLVRTDDLSRIAWPTLLTFGGGLALGEHLVRSGTSDWLVTRLDGLDGLPAPVALAIVATSALVLTAVASNTASAATLVPLAVPLAGMLGTGPVLLVLVVALASSIDFALVIGTPPTMLAYGTGLFRASEILRRGIVVDLAGLVLLVLVVPPIWELLGVT